VTGRNPLPPEIAGAPFRIATGLGAGLTRGRLRSLPNPFHGVRSAEPPATLVERARALQLVFRPADCFSHLTSAELIGLRLPQRRGGARLHVTTLGEGRAMRRPGVQGHVARGGRRLAVTPAGLVVTDPVETWADLAPDLPLDDLVAMADGLVARRAPLATIADLETAAGMGRRGASRLRAALPWVRAGTDSWRETMLRLALVRRGVPEPEVNAPIQHAGRIIAHGDLVWPEHRLVVEYEGRQHWDDAAQFRIDIERINRIVAGAWRHVRVDQHLLAAPDRLAHDVLALLTASRAA